MDELERLAGVGPLGAPKTVEMDSVERLMSKGHPAVLLRSAEVRCPPQKGLAATYFGAQTWAERAFRERIHAEKHCLKPLKAFTTSEHA